MLLLLALIACSPKSDDTTGTDPVDSVPEDTGEGCVPHAVVADIDGTITLSDEEFLTQMDDATYDPQFRPDADTLFNGYAASGFEVLYVTGRWETIELDDGRGGRQATEDWLIAHGFPYEPENLYLAPEQLSSLESIEFKSGVLTTLVAKGWVMDWAYGNSSSDINAFEMGTVPPEQTFSVDDDSLGVTNIPAEDAFTNHAAMQLPLLENVACE